MKKNSPPKIPFFFTNLENHMLRTFDLWVIKKPSTKIQIKRSLIFTTALIASIYWPIQNLFIQFILLSLAWTMLAMTNQKISRWLLLFNLMLNIIWIYLLMQFLLNTIS